MLTIQALPYFTDGDVVILCSLFAQQTTLPYIPPSPLAHNMVMLSPCSVLGGLMASCITSCVECSFVSCCNHQGDCDEPLPPYFGGNCLMLLCTIFASQFQLKGESHRLMVCLVSSSLPLSANFVSLCDMFCFLLCAQEDYRQTVRELDEKQIVCLRLTMCEMRNHYVRYWWGVQCSLSLFC